MQNIGWALSWTCRFLFATWVPASAKIGRNVKLGYWGLGIVIHKDAVIGDDCHIGHHVTIGRNPGRPGVPEIGNKVYIGTGSVVSGSIKIADRVVLGANSVALTDLPELALAVGAPCKIIRILSVEEHRQILTQ